MSSLVSNAVCPQVDASNSILTDSCYVVCGDITDVTSANGIIGDEADCNIPCPGDPVHLCGGGDRLNYYTWQGDLNVWHEPAVTGWYEVSLFCPLPVLCYLMLILHQS